MANKKTTKRTAAIFAVIGALSLTGGVLAQNREGAHAEGRKLLPAQTVRSKKLRLPTSKRRIRFTITAVRSGRFILIRAEG